MQSLFFEEKLADVLDERMEGFEKLQKELSAFADAVLVPDKSKLSAKQRLALYMSRDFQAATAIAGLDLKMRAERKLYVDEQNFDPVLAADRISTPPKVRPVCPHRGLGRFGRDAADRTAGDGRARN